MSEETRQRMSVSAKGKKKAPEAIEKRTGHLSHLWRGGLPKCADCNADVPNRKAKRCSACSIKRKIGVNAPNWKGGITPVASSIRTLDRYKQWRVSVFTRDGYKCVMCGSGGYVEADHITPFAVILRSNAITNIEQAIGCKELWHVENGRTLCKPCHKETPTYMGKMNMRWPSRTVV